MLCRFEPRCRHPLPGAGGGGGRRIKEGGGGARVGGEGKTAATLAVGGDIGGIAARAFPSEALLVCGVRQAMTCALHI